MSGVEETQAFDYYGQHWDIFTAQWLVTGRQPQLLEIDEALKEFTGTVTVDTERALATADLSQPVLVIPLPPEIFGPDAGDLVIDGYHRITRAIHETQTGLPAHFLTAGDERETRRGDTWDSLAPHIPWHASRRSTPEVSSD